MIDISLFCLFFLSPLAFKRDIIKTGDTSGVSPNQTPSTLRKPGGKDDKAI